MNDVYLVKDGITELLSVDYNFFNQAKPVDLVRIKGLDYEIKRKIYDPQEMDLFIEISNGHEILFLDNPTIKRYLEILKKEGKLICIKCFKEEFKDSLKEAKDYVDKIQQDYIF